MLNAAPETRTYENPMQSRFAELQHEVARLRDELESHPIARLCAMGTVPESILRDWARIQYVDSTLWIPMLALAKGQTKSPRLLQALKANIRCEAGDDGIPHVTLCREFVESLGEPTYYGNYQDYAPLAAHSVGVMNALASMSEEEMAGWLMATETLVPTFFAIFRPGFARIPGADLRYLDEHIAVDSDEHAEWMNESVHELLKNETSYERLLAGIRLGGRVMLSIPDALYARTLRSVGTAAVQRCHG